MCRSCVGRAKASKVKIENPNALNPASNDDNPSLGVLAVEVSGYATQDAYNASAALNARAARWTAGAAILTGAATILGAL